MCHVRKRLLQQSSNLETFPPSKFSLPTDIIMESRPSLCRDVLVIGDSSSQPQQVMAEMVNEFLNARGGEVAAEATPLRRRPSTQSRKHSSPGANRSRSRTAATRHSVVVNNNDGCAVRFNLTTLTHQGRVSADSNDFARVSAPHSDVVVVTFSVHSRESFETAHHIVAKAAKRNSAQLAGHKSNHTQFLLVGHHTKSCDAEDDLQSADWDQEESWAPTLWQQRGIHEEEAQQLANDQRHCTYHETCSDHGCPLQDCNTRASTICDDLITATSTSDRKKRVGKELGLKKWLKSTLRPKCLATDEEVEDEDEVDAVSIGSDQLGSLHWWDECSEGTRSQWSSLDDLEVTSLCASISPSLPPSPARTDSILSPSRRSSNASAAMSPSHFSLVIESF